MMNSLCFLVVAGAYIKLYSDLPRGDFEAVWDCAMVRHVAWLIFAEGLLYCPVTFLNFSSMLGLFPVIPEAVKSVLLIVLPLPACLNHLLYLLFNPHFRDDLTVALVLVKLSRFLQEPSGVLLVGDAAEQVW